jgi:hypothetical protein
MRFLAGIAVGVVLGFLGAYLAFRDTGPHPRAAGPGPASGPAAAAPDSGKAPAPPQDHPRATGRPGPLVVRFAGGGVTTTGDIVIIPAGEVVGGGERTLPEIEAALAAARAAADWGQYFRALAELGAMGTPEAHAVLVRLMGDESLRFEGPWTGQHFFRWLRGSDAEGLLEAARRRAEIDIADNPDSRWRGVGWLSLVALRGGPAEIEWLLSLGGGDQNREMEVDRALAEGASNPLAAARLASRLKDPWHSPWSPYLSSFAEANPPAALAAALDAMPEGRSRNRGELLRLVGEAATAETLDRARTALLGLTEPRVRLEAVRAVERMRERGLDVSGFQPLLDEPRLLLERSAAAPLKEAEKEAVRRALGVIEGSEATWSEATRAAAARMEGGGGGGGWRPERDSG